MRKHLIKSFAIILAVILSVASECLVSFAETGEDYDPNETKTWVNIAFALEVPEGFDENVQVYWDKVPVRFAPGSYSMTAAVAPGIHQMFVMSSTDARNRYEYEYPQTLNTATDKTFKVLVKDVGGFLEEEFDGEEGDGEKLGTLDENAANAVILPKEFDFTENNEPFGTVSISCKPCAAVKSVTYSLSSGEQYDIKLMRDYGFRATALLPAGEYKELALKEIELDEDVLANDYIFSFKHEDHPDFYGWTYTVEDGATLDITDLLMLMNVNGTVTEIDSTLLFAPKMIENKAKVVDEHVEDTLKEQFPEIYTESETETIPAYIPEIVTEEPAKTGSGKLQVALIVGAICLLVIICLIVTVRIRKRRDE